MKREQMDRLFDFLSQLRDHNTRDWFEAHRPLYAEVQRDFMSFVQELIDGISCFDSGVKGLTPKDATYRIYRDVRFSTDKSPYKTHLGTYICPGGKHSEYAGYYIHLEPGASVLATGIYRPRYKIVQSVWEEIFDHGAEFDAAVRRAEGFELDRENSLKRVPRAYPADSPWGEYLRLKDFTLTRSLTIEDALTERCLEALRTTLDFNQQLNRAIRFALEEM